MAELTTVSFGPQHPVLPEPIHLDLELKDEKVVRAVPSIGYVHRGLEKLVEKRDFKQFIYVAERVCGICSFGHGWGYAKAVEGLMEIDVPRRASYLRTIWHELSRLHSHLLWLGLGADALGFESLFMDCWRLREAILYICEDTTGGRVIFSVCEVGGVRRDLTDAMKKSIEERLTGLRKEIEEMASVFLYDDTIQTRLEGVGILSMNEAMDLGCVGPMARASGVPHKGEFFTRVEQPRGEAIYYIKGNGTKNLERFRLRTPTNCNIAALVKMLQGCDLADVPNIILTIDPCISCCER